MPGRILGVALAVGIALSGCGGAEDASDGAGAELTAAELGEVGARIYVDPDQAEGILAELELTREEFEARIREISARPQEARAYTEAFDAALAGSGVGVDVEAGMVDTGTRAPES